MGSDISKESNRSSAHLASKRPSEAQPPPLAKRPKADIDVHPQIGSAPSSYASGAEPNRSRKILAELSPGAAARNRSLQNSPGAGGVATHGAKQAPVEYDKKLHALITGQIKLSYSQRQEMMRKSPAGKDETTTAQIYLKTALPTTRKERREALKHRDIWLAERLHVQDAAQHSVQVRAESLHQRMEAGKKAMQDSGDTFCDWSKPVLVLLRGNSGVGKTSLLRSDALPPELRALQISAPPGEAVGALNPDDIKPLLIRADAKANISETTNQVHLEASLVTNRLFETMIDEGKNVVFDKRFLTPADMESFVVKAKSAQNPYRVIVIDMDAALADSLKGIAKREIGGNDPNVPYAAVESGFVSARSNRGAVTEFCQETQAEYFAFGRPSLPPEGGYVAPQMIAKQGIEAPLEVLHATLWTRANYDAASGASEMQETLEACRNDYRTTINQMAFGPGWSA